MDYQFAIESMLGNMDDWRHLPKYQMERRADLFFGLFIKNIVAASDYVDKKKPISDVVIPEFPYKNVENRNTTVNFDYVLFSEDTAFIIELKTEPNSAGDKNNPYLEELDNDNVSFTEIVNGLLIVSKKSRHKDKYRYLLDKLNKAGVIVKDEKDEWFCKREFGKPKIIYVAPELKKSNIGNVNLIDFHTAAKTLEYSGGPVEKLFASYLRKWQDNKAGKVNNEGNNHG